MNIIFGGNGFIGKNLSLEGLRPSKQECDLEDLESTISFLNNFIKEKELNIINLAAYVAGFTFNKDHNVEMLYKNSLIALNVIFAIKKLKLNPYYIYTSSVCAYKDGNDLEEKIFDFRPNNFNYGYGISKRLGINALESLALDIPNFKYAVLVPTNMYGKYDNFDENTSHVIPNLIRKIYNAKDSVEILGNANNKRDFLYAEDLSKIINIFLRHKFNGIYNASTNQTVSILELANKIKDILKYKHKFIYNIDGEPQIRKTSNESLMKLIGNFKFTNLDEGLKEAIKYYEIQLAVK